MIFVRGMEIEFHIHIVNLSIRYVISDCLYPKNQTTGTSRKGRAGGREFLNWNWNHISQCLTVNRIPTMKFMPITSLTELSCFRLLINGNRSVIMLPQYTSSNLAQSVTLLTYNQEERDSDLDWDTNYPGWNLFVVLLSISRRMPRWQLEIYHNLFFSSSSLINHKHYIVWATVSVIK
jgi:hypothetical protein